MLRHRLIVLLMVMPVFKCSQTRPGIHYYPSTYTRNWNDAHADCGLIGGILAKITTTQENEEIVDFMVKWNLAVMWIGGSDESGTWVWRDATAVDFSITHNVLGATHFLKMWQDGGWEASGKRFGLNFICEIDTASAEAEAVKVARACWVANGLFVPPPGTVTRACPRDIMYFVPRSAEPKDWVGAQEICQQAGGNLAKITTQEEMKVIARFRQTIIDLGAPWTAGNDVDQDGVYTWLVEPFTWPSYAVISSPTTVGQCIALATNYRWLLSDCSVMRWPLCEKVIRNLVVMEAHFDQYPTFDSISDLLFDGDNESCLTLNDYWTYLPMTTIRTTASGSFTVSLTVGADIQMTAETTTKVFISRSGTYTGDYYGAIELYNKCNSLPNLSFSCQCMGECSLYIRVRFPSMAAAEGIVYSVCGIAIV